MVVAVQKGLNNVEAQLRSMGYEVVTLGAYNYPVDAVVYNGSLETSYITNNNMPALTSSASGSSRNYGVLMVNSYGKSAAQIDEILKKRVYSPLF